MKGQSNCSKINSVLQGYQAIISRICKGYLIWKKVFIDERKLRILKWEIILDNLRAPKAIKSVLLRGS